MNVGLIQYGLDREATGIGRYTIELTATLEALGLNVHRLWAGNSPLGYDGQSLPGAYLLPGLLTIGQVEIAYQARKLKLDIIHDPTGVMPLWLASAARVTTIHDMNPLIFPETGTWMHRFLYHVWLPHAAPLADAVITDSRQSREDIVTHFSISPQKVVDVPLAADGHFRPMSVEEIAPILGEFSVDQPYILYVGALESRKNLPRLLEAYAQLRRWSTRWKLVVVGAQKWKFSPIFETVKRLQLEQHVNFSGYVADEHLPMLYSGADLFVFPSLYEGFGLPVLEAMACGTPVITSSTSSLPEVAGTAAILVDPTSVEDIATAMRRVLSDEVLSEELRQKGFKRAKMFTWERTARETIAVYKKVLSRKS